MTKTPIEVRVLIVEDCDDDYELLLLKLREDGFQPACRRVETIAEIESALAKDHCWQFVFSDFDLPGFDGLRVLEFVRERCPDIPFFIISGIMDEEQAVAAIKAGAQDYFFKGKLGRLGAAVTRELQDVEQRAQHLDDQAELDRGRNLLRHDRLRFIDIMSHELRTPLNIVNVAAAMLDSYDERMDAAGRKERIVEIRDAVARMTRIIDKVLLTSRLELRRWDLRAETLNLFAWCEEFLAENVCEGDRRQRIRVRVDAPADVSTDPRVLEIALENVLSNALKYSPANAPVDLEVLAGVAGEIQFVISDFGIGIPAGDLPNVFGSFYRGDNVGAVAGTGLGLAIVKACTDLLGGTLDVQSREGEGTCVTLCVPDWHRGRGTPENLLVPASGSGAEVGAQ